MNYENSPPLLGIFHVAVPVQDLERAVAFYCEELGFRRFDTQSKDWAMVALGQTSLSFFQLSPQEQEAQKRLPKSDAPYRHFGIAVPSRQAVDQWHGRLSHLPTRLPCKEHRDGSYGFYLRDSEGNFFEIIWIPEKSSRQGD